MQEGYCPKCGEDQLEYHETDLEGIEGIRYYYECIHCNFKGIEFYFLTFGGHYDRKGREVEGARLILP